MSRRRNGTMRAAQMLGINPWGWGNGGKRKRPKGAIVSNGAHAKLLGSSISKDGGKVNEES